MFKTNALLFIWRYCIVQAHKAPTWTHVNAFYKKVNPYQRTHTHRVPNQNSSNLESFSAPCQCSPPLPMLLLHDLLPSEEAAENLCFLSATSQQAWRARYFELSSRHNLHPWAVQLDDRLKGILKLAIKHSRNANTQQWAVPSKLLRSIECSGPCCSILYMLCDWWAEWKMKAI